MQLRVLLFAVLADRLGTDHVTVDLPAGTTVTDLLDRLSAQHAAVAELRGSLAVAVNHAYAAGDHVLHADDEVALIPPVSGG